MKPILPLMTAMLLFYVGGVDAQGNHPPPNGYVPDAKTAIRIAVAVWSPIYGEKQIQSEKPFHASLKHGVWTVTGSLPGPPTVGGTGRHF